MAAMASFKQQCPSCEALIPIRDPAMVGRKIDCPKCKYRFVVKEPAEEKGEDEDEEIEAITSKAAKKPRSAGVTDKKPSKAAGATDKAEKGEKAEKGGKSKSAKSKGGKKSEKNNTPLIIGGALALVALVGLGVAGYVIFGGSSKNKPAAAGKKPNAVAENKGPDKAVVSPHIKKEEPVPRKLVDDITNLLPPDTQAIAEVPSVENLLIPTLHAAAFDTPGAFRETPYQGLFGFSSERAGQLLVGLNYTENWIFSVVRVRTPFTAAETTRLKTALKLTEKDHLHGHTLYFVGRQLDSLGNLLFKGNQPRDLYVNFMDDYTLVFGSEKPLRQLLAADYVLPHLSKGGDAPRSTTTPATGTPATGTPATGTPAPTKTPADANQPKPNPPPTGSTTPPDTGKPQATTPNGTTTPTTPVGDGDEGSSSYLTIQPPFKVFMDQLRKGDPLVILADDPTLKLVRLPALKLLADAGPFNRSLFKVKDFDHDVVRAGLRLDALAGDRFIASVIAELSDENIAKARKAELESALGLDTTTEPTNPMRPPNGGVPGPGPTGPNGPRPPGPPGPPGPVTPPPVYVTLTVVGKTLFIKVNQPFSPEDTRRKKTQVASLFLNLKGEADMTNTQSRVFQLVKAMNGYVEKNKQFPRGTIERIQPDTRPIPWAPDQRLSWMVELLPFLPDRDAGLVPDRTRSWNEGDKNPYLAQMVVPAFVVRTGTTPTHRLSYPGMPDDVAATHFVGIAGVGYDAASYNASNPKAGVFGYDRVTKLDQIKNPAQTIVLLQVPDEQRAPWLAGGGSTVRGVSEGDDCLTPFLCVENDKRRGTYALMADFKVRFLPETIDKKKFREMCQINGAKIEDLDSIAPVVTPPTEEEAGALPPPVVNLPPVEKPREKPVDIPSDKPSVDPKTNGGWQVHSPTGGGFKVSLPPGEKSLGDNGKMYIVEDRVDKVHGVFLKASDGDERFLAGGPNASFARALRIEVGENKVVQEKNITLGSNPGYEFVYESPKDGKIRVRYYLVNRRFYSLSAHLGGPLTPQDVDRFFNSFALTEQPAPGVQPPMEKPADKAGQDPKPNGEWQAYNSKEGRYKLLVPPGKVKKEEAWDQLDIDTNNSVGIGYGDTDPKDLAVVGPEFSLNAFENGYENAQNKKKITLGKYPGRAFNVVNGFDGSSTYFRIYQVESRFYQVVIKTNGRITKQEIDKIFNSFEVTGK